ncbi:DNA helicase-2/ATP-dependent DNA helicase PcrA [Friedmanniella endophytica]|uniref:DNA 3'-5' helicase n=1 Tax=Microlunatus kandeliicorticis TaxID=1759536 RepID=A0A7W3IUQ8_9ACTN|nr:ATP-dependent DNA helicase [Microlunatus kandeliicorticis]MBA8795636.1 DNA helicase-2/ATP-dependent DNA helicase PcrA [Microlunatus kandeliicorticis]
MTVTALPVPRRSNARVLAGPGDLVDALGIPFSEQQLEAITAPLEPGVIIAGAGSGKTTVMAARVVWLVGTGAVRPEEVLGLTFTRKAAAELSARVRTALLSAGVVDERGVDEAGEQLIMTYDAFAARLVAEHGLRIGVDADATMITGATRFRLASRVVRSAAGPFEHLSRLRPDTVAERVLKLDADLASHLVDPARLDRHARANRIGFASAPPNQRGNTYAEVKKALAATDERLELASLVRDYQQLKSRLGVIEFADQMAIAARLAVEVPEVSDQLRSAFGVVLLDEYQDTSAAQAIMLRGLFSGHAPLTGRGHPVTAVGDPFQAIYGWRGAAASNILQFADQFRRRDDTPAARFSLTVNRRSGPRILDVANRLAGPLRVEVSERLAALVGPDPSGRPDLDPLRAPDGTRPGQVRAATFDTWAEEVTWIADRIVADRGTDAPRWSDIAVLTRRNADIGAIYAELTARDVPTEIVGLGGLLSLPEVMDVTATLRLIDDVTANPELVRLLTGPRWRIGPRDLALLGRRARQLAEHDHGRPSGARPGSRSADEDRSILGALEEAVADVDPTEVVSLLDALEHPVDPEQEAAGEGSSGGFSAEALTRFAALAAELAQLRRHAEEPLLDLCRRVITVLGLDVELTATTEYARTRRRDQLGAFLDAVADYVDVDGQASLSGLLAYLRAESEQGAGLEQALPTAEDSVKLLTVHKAKGLEWEVVYLPALMQGTFPSDRVSDNWVSSAAVLPADLRGDAGSIPQLEDHTGAAVKTYTQRLREQQLLAEDRLAYVAVTRARSVLVGTGHTWRVEAVRPRVPSNYLKAIIAAAREQDQLLAEAGPVADANPLEVETPPTPWPQPLDPDGWQRRQDAAQRVRLARRRFAVSGRYDPPAAEAPDQLRLDEEEQVAAWDADIDQLLGEARAARRGRRSVELPGTLSATNLLRLRTDPGRYAAELARPMPRRPSTAARFGTRFHQWVEQHLGSPDVQPSLIDPDDSTDRTELDAATEGEFAELCTTFAAGPFGSARPFGLEIPFSVLIAGRVVRGRIDAVYRAGPDGSLPGDDRLDLTTRAGPSDTRAEPSGTRAEPVEAPTSTAGTRAEPSGTRAEPSGTRAEPVEAQASSGPQHAEPSRTRAEPVEAPTSTAGTRAEPPGTRAEPVEAPASSGTTQPEPSGARAEPVEALASGEPTHAESSGTAAEPVEAPTAAPGPGAPPYRYRIVDWKTAPGDGPGDRADPWQLALYRLAWAELSGVGPEEVDAVFYFVGSDTVVRPPRLADRAAVEAALRAVPLAD